MKYFLSLNIKPHKGLAWADEVAEEQESADAYEAEEAGVGWGEDGTAGPGQDDVEEVVAEEGLGYAGASGAGVLPTKRRAGQASCLQHVYRHLLHADPCTTSTMSTTTLYS